MEVHPATATELENPEALFLQLMRQQIESAQIDFLVIVIEQIADSIAGRRARVLG